LKTGINALSRNVGHQSPSEVEQYPRGTKISVKSHRKTQVTRLAP